MLIVATLFLPFALAVVWQLVYNRWVERGWTLDGYSQTMRNIPILGAPFWFEWDVHKQAIKNALIAWILVTSPIFLAVLFAASSGSSPIALAGGAGEKFLAIVKADGIYVYCASFLTPYLAIGIGRLIEACHRKLSQEDDGTEAYGYLSIRRIFGGYWWGFLLACCLLFLTAMAYAGQILSPLTYSQSNLNQLLKNAPLWIYGLSLYLWYIAFLDMCNSSNFTENFRSSENAAVSSFQKALSKNRKRNRND